MPGLAVPDHDALLRETSPDPKPNFTLTDIAGRARSLADYAGRPLLLHFFATWCEPCRPEMVALDRLAARGDIGPLRILAISIAEPDGRVRRFFDSAPVRFPVLLDRDRAVAKSWNVAVLPTTYLLDINLVPRLFVERDLEWDRLNFPQIMNALSRRDRGHVQPAF